MADANKNNKTLLVKRWSAELLFELVCGAILIDVEFFDMIFISF
jgi:hypothetical protein